MCRLVAYFGAPVSLGSLVLEPQHSLYNQSWQARELVYAKVNADGFGFGWYSPAREPRVYRQVAPIWADANLPVLCDELRAPLWLAMVRSATVSANGQNLHDVQPFKFGRHLFMHNGFVADFDAAARRRLIEQLDDATLGELRGLTDSEHLCALAHHFMQAGDDAPAALAKTRDWCAKRLKRRAMLNLLVADGRGVCAMRAAVGEDAPSLYYMRASARSPYPEGALVVASEKLDRSRAWQAFAPGQILSADANGEARVETL